MGILYVVATPIGNLDDITLRAIKILLTVDAIACEDTRKASFLLKAVRQRYTNVIDNVLPVEHQELFSYYEQVEQQRIPQIVTGLKNGLSVALISDAGTPAISDPGFRLVRECLKEGIQVVSIPGPSSVISALVSSGLPTDKFLFLGYPPRKPGHRMKFFENAKQSQDFTKATLILFEAPHKLITTLGELQKVFGDIEITLARELTKVHEEVVRKRIAEWIEIYKKKDPKGEFVLLFTVAS
jgi:16S rRNA (cytidine1402-2'-O)-methyltransferase